MLEPIFSPLKYYLRTAKDAHSQNVRDYLSLLSNKANVDREANAKTVAKLDAKEAQLNTLQQNASGKKSLRTLIVALAIIADFIFSLYCFSSDMSEVGKSLSLLGGLALCIFIIVFTCKKLNARLRALNEQIAQKQAEADVLRREAWAQVAPLNVLFKEDDSLNLFTKTLPFITFDKCFTDTRLLELMGYGFSGSIDGEECILDTLSGELYGSPFVYVQKRSHRLGTKTYRGSLTISWTTTSKDSKGNTVTHHHSQTLHASITRPAPFYHTDTALYFGNQAVPNVNFSRMYAHVEDKSESAIDRKVRKGEKKIQRLEEKALREGDDFQGVANAEFDVLFGATNRTNDLEFLQMFTPRAQESMLELLLYKEGYGDDFSFAKYGTLCAIRSEHSQGVPLYPTANAYYSHNVTEAESSFIWHNENFFRSVYFDFAPLLLIPVYQQPLIRSEPIQEGGLTAYNYEAIAYRLGSILQPNGIGTPVIFKTALQDSRDDERAVQVCAYAYQTVERVHYESMYGGDGYWHNVPVHWTEYIPVRQDSVIKIVKGDGGNSPSGGTTYRGYYAYKA